MDLDELFKVLANANRLRVLAWLRDPPRHFPPQRDGNLVADGVCVLFIAHKLGVAQPSATMHLQALKRAGLVTSKKPASGPSTSGMRMASLPSSSASAPNCDRTGPG